MFTYLAADSSRTPAFALVSPHAVLLLRHSSDASAVGDQFANLLDLWNSLHESDPAELIAGLHALPRNGFDNFALIAQSPNEQTPPDAARTDHLLSIAVGGAGRASIDGGPALNSAGGIAIIEAQQGKYEHVLLTVGNAATTALGDHQALQLPITGGIVRCNAVSFRATSNQGAVAAAPVAPRDAAPHVGALPEVAPREVAPSTTEQDDHWPVPSFEAAREAAAETVAVAGSAPSAEPTESPQPAAAHDAQPTNQFDHLFEHTQFFDVEGAAVRQSEEADEAIHEADEKPSTRPPVPAAVRLSITLPDGSACPLDKPVFVGRRPMLPADADHGDYHLVRLEDLGGGLSRMHIRIDPHKGGAMVTDLDSTNGTVLITEGTKVLELRPSTPHFAKAGDEIRLGNAIRLSFTIE